MTSLVWEGAPSGCSMSSEEAYRKEIDEINGPHAAALKRLRKIICQAYKKLEKEREMNGDPVYTITSHKVDESNRCDACRFNSETMAECFIFCPFRCKECPWKNVRPEAMKMITETALMTDDEMAKKGTEPDSVYETRRKGESLKGFMSRVDRMVQR